MCSCNVVLSYTVATSWSKIFVKFLKFMEYQLLRDICFFFSEVSEANEALRLFKG